MAISADKVKELREKTGAGMMECKRALEEAGGDMERAANILREKGRLLFPSAMQKLLPRALLHATFTPVGKSA